jgi:hypothetical protein
MAIVRTTRDEVLRLGPGASGEESRLSGASLVFADIPALGNVHAYVHRPTELKGAAGLFGVELSDGGAAAGATQPYRFELAQPPADFTVGGATFARPRTRQRVLVADGRGHFWVNQEVPAFAAFAPVQDGALVQCGRKEHMLPMPGNNVPAGATFLLRFRWVATAVVAEVQASPPMTPGVPDGIRRSFRGQLGNLTPNSRIAPGSVVFTATVTALALTIRDDGLGRLVGIRRDANGNVTATADGLINYLTGQWSLDFGPPPPATAIVPDAATNISASYEHSCPYLPLDVHLEWDVLLQ